MFEIVQSQIPGCFEIIFKKLDDNRGSFIKTFNIDFFEKLNIRMEFREEYFTRSSQNVFRGLHFQDPPKALDKIVYCVDGKVTDYVVDLRKGSPTYGKWTSFELDGNTPKAVFVPIGIAHGFHVTSESALMQYKVSETYDPVADNGILYTSFSFSNAIKNPVMSSRDLAFMSFEQYNSPFTYTP